MDFLPAISSPRLEDAIVKTVAFFDVLEYPLTVQEVSDRLLGYVASESDILVCLRGTDRLIMMRGYVVFPGRERLIEQRLSQVAADQRLWKRVRKYAWVFRVVPFVQEVYICNRLAITQGTDESDIDVFVVARQGRMFFVRTLLLGLFQLFGVRRHGSRVAGRFCLSFFVDSSSRDLEGFSDSSSDVYFAYWLLLLRPLFAHEDIRFSNPWLEKYFPRELVIRQAQQTQSSGSSFVRRGLERLFSGTFGDFVEKRLVSWQLLRARKKFEAMGSPHGVVLTEHALKFHDRDMRRQYFSEWRKRVEKY